MPAGISFFRKGSFSMILIVWLKATALATGLSIPIHITDAAEIEIIKSVAKINGFFDSRVLLGTNLYFLGSSDVHSSLKPRERISAGSMKPILATIIIKMNKYRGIVEKYRIAHRTIPMIAATTLEGVRNIFLKFISPFRNLLNEQKFIIYNKITNTKLSKSMTIPIYVITQSKFICFY